MSETRVGILPPLEEQLAAERAARKEAQRQHDRLWHEASVLKARCRRLEEAVRLAGLALDAAMYTDPYTGAGCDEFDAAAARFRAACLVAGEETP